MKYVAQVSMTREQFDRVNYLLSIDDLSQCKEGDADWGFGTCEGIFECSFDDGSYANYDLYCGTTNFFDNLTWTSPDGTSDVTLESTYELDTYIEFYIDDKNIYCINISLTE